MAKRSRVSGRPGGRPRPGRSGSARPGPASAAPRSASGNETPPVSPATGSGTLTEAEAQRAAALEAEIVAQEKAAAQARTAALSARARRAGARYEDPELAAQPLSVRAAREYAYVARDVRRITLTAGLMLAILIALALAINVAGIIQI